MTILTTEYIYKLPWQEYDNPNGWIEPTTYCQINCPGCYRGIDKKDHNPKHEVLDSLKKQIDWFVKKRNVQTISIAGGEPLLYPYINELVAYCCSKGLRTMLYTNGVALNKEVLLNLKDAGLTQVLIHIDRYQQRDDLNSNTSINNLKLKYCDLFRDVTGVLLGFIQPISADHISEIDRINQFAIQNIDIVNLIVYTLYQEIGWTDETKQNINTSLNVTKVYKHLQLLDNFIPGAYLPAEKNESEYTWLFGLRIGVPNLSFGYFTSRLYKLIQTKYRRRNGRFLFISRHHTIKPNKLLKFFWIKHIINYLGKYLHALITGKTRSKKIYLQTTLILRGPIKRGDEWDLCHACPDRIINNNKLVPSCILNEIKSNKSEHQSVTI